MLGLKPTAANDEIARAFARESSVFRPQPFGGIAEVCVAYETLRDPIKRRAYDASLGLEPERLPPEPRMRSIPRPKLLAEQISEPPAAALLRPMDPIARHNSSAPSPTSELRDQPQADATPPIEEQVGGDRSRYVPVEERLDLEAVPIDWKRTGTTLGAVVVLACLFGGLAGWWSASDVGDGGPQATAVSVPLPPAKPLATSAAALPAPASEADTQPDRPRRPALAAASLVSTPAVPQRIAGEQQPPEPQSWESEPQLGLAHQDEPGLTASEEDAANTPITSTVAAGLPLPNKLVARTIERIGYACGAVASTNPVEGEAPGVYKVTCTSGQSYQAKPVNGRYHFRRWGRN
jgi:hypothetical protein